MGTMTTRDAQSIVFVLIVFEGSIGVIAKSLDFYYFVQQWPASYCHSRDTRGGCCYPQTGKPPSDFSVHGLWPNFKEGHWPKRCDPSRKLNFSKISDLEEELNSFWGSLSCSSRNGHKFWEHEWRDHGTCSHNLDVRSYFEKTLSLRKKIDLLGALQTVGIQPDGNEYSLSDIKEAIRQSTGELPGVRCNTNNEGKRQIFEVYVCVDKFDASTVIKCPIYPRSDCPSMVVFPPLEDDDQEDENIINGTDEL